MTEHEVRVEYSVDKDVQQRVIDEFVQEIWQDISAEPPFQLRRTAPAEPGSAVLILLASKIAYDIWKYAVLPRLLVMLEKKFGKPVLKEVSDKPRAER